MLQAPPFSGWYLCTPVYGFTVCTHVSKAVMSERTFTGTGTPFYMTSKSIFFSFCFLAKVPQSIRIEVTINGVMQQWLKYNAIK